MLRKIFWILVFFWMVDLIWVDSLLVKKIVNGFLNVYMFVCKRMVVSIFYNNLKVFYFIVLDIVVGVGIL